MKPTDDSGRTPEDGVDMGAVDTVWPAEAILSESLRECCTIFGKEREDTLAVTADILLKLGRLYREKAKVSSGILQKLTLLRCSALLNGAKIRYGIVSDGKGVEEAKKNLVELGKHAMRLAGAKTIDVDLVETSMRFLEQVRKMRRNNIALLGGMPEFNELEVGEKLRQSRKVKSKYVRHMNEVITDEYTGIMAAISRECVALLGNPPCKFAAVGLGSMARKEITPFSDFEHVIVLEEGAQHTDGYASVKEYFRWYAVCFQLIFINFGETFIRSVGVKSLNDLYAEDKRKNWFYDVYTPCGMAFDGMVPHSCNNPLGRQEPTKLRTHVVELIQPVGEMAQLVNRENKLKNGYYVNEILTRTCFVDGDEDVFSMFYNHVGISVKAENLQHMAEAQFDTMRFNCNPNVKDMRPHAGTYFNMKEKMYRPITVLLSCLARINKIVSPSSFAIVDVLVRNKTIDETFADEIRFALALACEFRARHYCRGESQRYEVEVKSMIKSMGLNSYLHFCLVLENLRRATRYCIAAALRQRTCILWRELSQYVGDFNPNIAKANCLYQSGLYDEAIEVAGEFVERDNLINKAHFLNIFVLGYLAKNNDPDAVFNDTQRCLKHLDFIESLGDVTEEMKLQLVPLRVTVLSKMERHEEAILQCDAFIERISGLTSPPPFVVGTKERLEEWKAVLLNGLKKYNLALEHCNKILNGELENFLQTRWALAMQTVDAKFGIGKSDEAHADLRRIKKTVRTKGKAFFTEELSVDVLYQIMRCEFEHDLYHDVIDTSKLLEFLVREPDVRFELSYRNYIIKTGRFFTAAYIKLNRHKECVRACTELIDITKRMNELKQTNPVDVSKETYQRLALAYSHLGTDKTLTPMSAERIVHMRKAVEIFQKYPKDGGIEPFYRPVLANLIWALHTLSLKDKISDSARCNEIRTLIANAPTKIRRSERMQPPVIAFALKMVAMVSHILRTARGLQAVKHLLGEMRGSLQHQTTHPVVFLSIMKLLHLHHKNTKDPMALSEILRFKYCFLSRYDNVNISPAALKQALAMYANLDLIHAISRLWTVLCKNQSKQDAPNVINLMLSAIVVLLNRPGKSIGFMKDCICLL